MLRHIFILVTFFLTALLAWPQAVLAQATCGFFDPKVSFPDGSRACLSEYSFFTRKGLLTSFTDHVALAKAHSNYAIATTSNPERCPFARFTVWERSAQEAEAGCRPRLQEEIKKGAEFANCDCDTLIDSGRTRLPRREFERRLAAHEYFLNNGETLEQTRIAQTRREEERKRQEQERVAKAQREREEREERERIEQARQAEEQRRIAEARKREEERRLQEQERVAKAQREREEREDRERIEQARQAEEQRLIAEARKREEERKLKEQERVAQAQREREEREERERIEQARQAEEQRRIAEARKREEERKRQEQERVAKPTFASRRALVIGNDSYGYAETLKTAREDARAIAASFERVGYTVSLHLDLNERAMKAAIRTFVTQIQGGDEVAFFFAGHGLQIGSTNYLIPIDTAGESELQIRDEAVDLKRILDDVGDRRARFTLAVIDACRDNPFRDKTRTRMIGSTGRGLAPTTPATGQMIIFSAGSGQKALDNLGDKDPDRNGVFTRVFVQQMRRPSISIDRIARDTRAEVVRLASSIGHEQVPAIYDQVIGEFFFIR